MLQQYSIFDIRRNMNISNFNITRFISDFIFKKERYSNLEKSTDLFTQTTTYF